MNRSGETKPQIRPDGVTLQRPDPVRSGPGCDVGWLKPAPESTDADTVWEDTTSDQATALVLSAVSGRGPGIQLEWPDDAGLAGAIAWLIDSAHGCGREEPLRCPDTSAAPDPTAPPCRPAYSLRQDGGNSCAALHGQDAVSAFAAHDHYASPGAGANAARCRTAIPQSLSHTLSKPATELLPPDVLLQVAGLLGDSAGAHVNHDFAAGRPWSVDYAALQRHLLAFWAGENADPGSGRSHAIHIAARGLLLAAAVLRHPRHDDRPPLTRPPTGPPAG